MHNAQLKIYNRLNCLGYSNLRQFAIKSNRLLLLLIFLFSNNIEAKNLSIDYTNNADSIDNYELCIMNCELNRWDFLMNWNFMALPYPSYSPETSWQFGITGVWYFHTSKQSTQFSDLNFDMGYTLNRQWYINANSRIYFNTSTRWYLDAYLSAKHYPDLFFDTTNNIDSVYNPALRYTSNFIDLQARPSFYISKHWLAGATLHLRYENSIIGQQSTDDSQHSSDWSDESDKSDKSDKTLNSQLYNGFGENLFLGIGASISYDTRINNYYPLNGLFFKTTITYYQQFPLNNEVAQLLSPCLRGTSEAEGVLNSQLSTFNFQLDLRHYIPLYKELILAWNFRSEIAVGNNVPFQLLPTIGGQDLVRGIRQNKFKDNTLFALQTELRIPIWRFLKGAVFASIGDVYNYNNWHWTTPKIGYGVGLRACIHQAKTNIRFDVARQNYSNDWSFYFTVKEAF